jgi:hypothetical protein
LQRNTFFGVGKATDVLRRSLMGSPGRFWPVGAAGFETAGVSGRRG